MVCRKCVIDKRCPLCRSLFHADIKPFTQLERIISIFKALDDAMFFSVREQGRQSIADHNADENRQGSQVDTCRNTNFSSGIELPYKANHLSRQSASKEILQNGVSLKRNLHESNNCTKEKLEGLERNLFNESPNNLESHPSPSRVLTAIMPRDGLASRELVNFGSKTHTCNAGNSVCDTGNGTFINLEEPFTPPSIHDSKNPEDNRDRSSNRDSKRLSTEGLPEEMTAQTSAKKQVAQFPFTDPSAGEALQSGKSNGAKTHIPVSPSEADNVREVKRQKLNIEHGGDCNDKQLGITDHAYADAAVKCAFCHSSEITKFTGLMQHYINEKPARKEEINLSNIKHVHEKCFEWAPQAYFEGEIAKNLESELARASKIKCSKCGRTGAALGCFIKNCKRSYHVPCANKLPGCRWDKKNFNLLCPSHSSHQFPSERAKVKWMTKGKRSPRIRDKCKTRGTAKKKWSSAQIIPGQSASIAEEQNRELWTPEPGVCHDLVLCGSDLSPPDSADLEKLASLIGASVTSIWKSNVTHVIASTDEYGACSRSKNVLMAILNGKWVLTIEWVKASMEAKSPVPEETYEISRDCYGAISGPKKGRTRAMQKGPKIFSGLCFYFCDQFDPLYRSFLEEIVLAADGKVLKNVEVAIEGLNANVFSPGSSFIVFSEDPPQMSMLVDLEEIARKRCEEVGALEEKTGFKVIGHMKLLDHIASCSSAVDLAEAAIQ
ncbi:BRCA1-associated RING domain protein 1-like isoform X2 [Asparagus officinalis]|uniref:BRCA1-associated RING domain protein 1-like isoform X2 n=1 Tax=Asparagus officinalis TaxID=4686 RepID=UPI00098E4E2A|nr:BRCA1-associated RING domain protein 1-like isoform X2 [Asparagus officinalis]